MTALWINIIFLATVVVHALSYHDGLPNYKDHRYIVNTERQQESTLSENHVFAVDDFVGHLMDCGHVPGLAVAVVKNNVTWTRGYGVKDLRTQDAVDSDTLFGIGSLTKAFTAALLGVALEREADKTEVTWKTKVKDVLGDDFKLIDGLEQFVTLEDMLAHRTGLLAADILAPAGFPPGLNRGDFIKRLRYLPDWWPWRTGWHYNNWVYTLAADVTAKLLGKPWQVLLMELLLGPLEMKNAKVVWRDVNVTSSKMARPYYEILGNLQELDESLFDLGPGTSSGALAASADDMARWMQFLLNRGVSASGHRVLGADTLSSMMTSHVRLMHTFDVPVNDEFKGYGLGWIVGAYRGKRRVSHTGEWFGYRTSLALFPDEQTAVYVALSGPGTQAASQVYSAITYLLADLSLGDVPWINKTLACSLVQEARKANEKRPRRKELKDKLQDVDDVEDFQIQNVHRCLGRFGHPFFGEVEITNTSKELHGGLLFRFQRLEGIMIPAAIDDKASKETNFHVRYTGKTAFYSYEFDTVEYSKLSFVKSDVDSEGKYNSLVLRAPWPEDDEGLKFERNIRFAGF